MATAFWFIVAPILVYFLIHLFVPNEPIDRDNRELIDEMKEFWRRRVDEDRIQ